MYGKRFKVISDSAYEGAAFGAIGECVEFDEAGVQILCGTVDKFGDILPDGDFNLYFYFSEVEEVAQ